MAYVFYCIPLIHFMVKRLQILICWQPTEVLTATIVMRHYMYRHQYFPAISTNFQLISIHFVRYENSDAKSVTLKTIANSIDSTNLFHPLSLIWWSWVRFKSKWDKISPPIKRQFLLITSFFVLISVTYSFLVTGFCFKD